MLVYLAQHFAEDISWLRVFNYLTMRGILALLTSLLILIFLGPKLIRKLQENQIGQAVRDDGPQTHLKKNGTPTMGGLLILLSMTISTLLWADLTNKYIFVTLLTTLAFGFLGYLDDRAKVKFKNSKGLSAKTKYFWQSFIAISVAILLYASAQSPFETSLFIPFFKNIVLPLGIFYVILVYFVIVGASNAVNLTDGLDGLAIMPSIMVAAALGVFGYVAGNVTYAEYLFMPYIAGSGEITIFAATIVGAGLGFLWFNTYPAQVFMGDVGSLALGAALGCMAIAVRQELVFFLMSGIFVIETLSVIIQVASFKLRGKRVFRMAPIHHHFELKGWAEPKVIVRFWIITLILVLIGLATLKLR